MIRITVRFSGGAGHSSPPELSGRSPVNCKRVLGRKGLIFPEGRLTLGTEMQPFKSGTGLLAVEGGVPVVLIRVTVHASGRPWKFPILQRGSVEVRFGRPLAFKPWTSFIAAGREIEQAASAL